MDTDNLKKVPETENPLETIGNRAEEAAALNGSVERTGMKIFPAQWKQGKWIVFGLAVKSSTGEIVAKVPKSKRLIDRNKYDSRGRLKSQRSESE